MKKLDKIFTDIIIPTCLIVIVFILTIIYLGRYLNYEKFEISLSNNVQLIDLPGAQEYIAISAETDRFIGNNASPTFDQKINYFETIEGIDFAMWNKIYKQIAISNNIQLNSNNTRTAVMERIDSQTVRFKYSLAQSKETLGLKSYRIILGSKTDILEFSLDQRNASFVTGGCNLKIVSINNSNFQFKTSADIPKAILIEAQYTQNIDLEFDLVVDCK